MCSVILKSDYNTNRCYRKKNVCGVFLRKNKNLQKISSYRLHKVKHLPLLDFLHFEDVLQRNLVEMLPDVIYLAVGLQQRKKAKKNSIGETAKSSEL